MKTVKESTQYKSVYKGYFAYGSTRQEAIKKLVYLVWGVWV